MPYYEEIPVCEEISMEMNRIDALIENPGVYYDELAMDGYVRFCEDECTLTDGSDLNLLDTFKLWAEEVFAGVTSLSVLFMSQTRMGMEVTGLRRFVRSA